MLYNDELLKNLRKKVKVNSIISIVLAVLIVAVTTVGFILVKEETASLFKIIISVIDVLLSFVIIYIVSNDIFDVKKTIKHFVLIQKSESVVKEGVLLSVSKEKLTVSLGITCYVLEVKVNKEIKQYYFNSLFDISNLKINSKYKFELVGLFVKELK